MRLLQMLECRVDSMILSAFDVVDRVTAGLDKFCVEVLRPVSNELRQVEGLPLTKAYRFERVPLYNIPNSNVKEFTDSVWRAIAVERRVEVYEITKFDNSQMLDPFIENVFDFLACYGYQEECFMRLDPFHIHVLNCMLKYNVTRSGNITVCQVVDTGGLDAYMDPVYRTSMYYGVSPYDYESYLEQITQQSSMGRPCVIQRDDVLVSVIDEILQVAETIDVDPDKQHADIVLLISKIPLVNSTPLIRLKTMLMNLKQPTTVKSGQRNLLLNYCMAFVLSRCIGLTFKDCHPGSPNVDRRLVALSYILRAMLLVSGDGFNRNIRDFVRHISSRRNGTIWTLFP